MPYRGSAPMMNDWCAAKIPMAFDAMPTALPQLQSGKIRAVGAGVAKRARALPDLPTLQEQGLPGFECYTWNVIVRAGRDAGADHRDAQRGRSTNRWKTPPVPSGRLQDNGRRSDPERHAQCRRVDFIKAELAKWAPIIKASGAEASSKFRRRAAGYRARCLGRSPTEPWSSRASPGGSSRTPGWCRRTARAAARCRPTLTGCP